MSEQGTQPDTEKDQYSPDTEFGRRAARDDERLDEVAEHDAVWQDLSGEMPDESTGAPRAASKAEPASAAGGEAGLEDSSAGGRHGVDEASAGSFPASDPPSSTGSTASG